MPGLSHLYMQDEVGESDSEKSREQHTFLPVQFNAPPKTPCGANTDRPWHFLLVHHLQIQLLHHRLEVARVQPGSQNESPTRSDPAIIHGNAHINASLLLEKRVPARPASPGLQLSLCKSQTQMQCFYFHYLPGWWMGSAGTGCAGKMPSPLQVENSLANLPTWRIYFQNWTLGKLYNGCPD